MSFELIWLGQGGYLFRFGEKVLCVDPYLSNSVFEAEGLQRIPPLPVQPQELQADLIITTHDHIDHLDEQTLWHVQPTKIGGPASCLQHLCKMDIPEERLVHLGRGETLRLGEAVLHGVYAEHTTDSIGVVIEYEGTGIYLVGDSLYSDELLDAAQFHPSLLICCINGRWGNMNAAEAAKLAEKLHVKTAIPSHYGMFAENTADPEEFRRALGNKVNCQVMEMGKIYRGEEFLAGR
jgi:L-ascorbate 6-phosphate lactonase